MKKLILMITLVFVLTSCDQIIVENQSPIITGDSTLEYVVNSVEPDWNSLVVATDVEDGAIIIDASMVDTSNVDMTTVGSFGVVYSVTDSGGLTATFTILVEIIEESVVSGSITLIGQDIINHEAGSTFNDPGATCLDNDGNAVNYTVNGSVNTNVIGTYVLSYTSDFDGEVVTRTVHVDDTTAPTYTVSEQSFGFIPPTMGTYGLTGGSPVQPQDWTNYIYNISDSFSGNLTSTVISDNVLYDTEGTYQVTVRVSDEYSNYTEKTFDVNIYDASTTDPVPPSDSTDLDFNGFFFNVHSTNMDNYDDIIYSIEFFNEDTSEWETLSGFEDVPYNNESVFVSVSAEKVNHLYRMVIEYYETASGEKGYNYGAAYNLYSSYNKSTIDVTDTTVSMSLNADNLTIGKLIKGEIIETDNGLVVGEMNIENSSDMYYNFLSPETDYKVILTFEGDYKYEFKFTTLEDTTPVLAVPRDFPLTQAEYTAMENYIGVFVQEYFNYGITDEDFCEVHYYKDEKFDLLSTVTTGQQICTTYRSSDLSLGGVYTLLNIEYITHGYSEDGTQEYRFALTFYYNGGPGITQFGYRVYHFNIVQEASAYYGHQEMDFSPTYTMLYTSQSEMDEYVSDWVSNISLSSTATEYCTDRSFTEPSLACIDLISEIKTVDITGFSYEITMIEETYSVVRITLATSNPTTSEVKYFTVPVIVYQQYSDASYNYVLTDYLIHEEYLTLDDKTQIITELNIYLEKYFDETITLEEFLLEYGDEYLDIDVYRPLDLENNIDATLIDIVYYKYTFGFGGGFKVYYENDGITKVTVIGYRVTDNSIRQPEYLLAIVPE